jgi:hypothetical protein
MIDIHPPQHAAITRRDFFVHLGIVVLGILIAIGLEQTVEAIHHAHQRRELIANVHDECARNLRLLDSESLVHFSSEWESSIVTGLADAQPVAGLITIVLPPRTTKGVFQSPSRAVWPLAQANGQASLLNENLAEVFGHVDFEADQWNQRAQQYISAVLETQAVALRLHINLQPGVTLHLSPTKANNLAVALSHEVGEAEGLEFSGHLWAINCQAVLSGIQTRAAMTNYQSAHTK